MKTTWLILVALALVPGALAQTGKHRQVFTPTAPAQFIQGCAGANSTFFPTTTVSCTLNGVGANHLIVVLGWSCSGTCFATGTQATHVVTDGCPLTWTQSEYRSLRSGGGSDIAADSLNWAMTGACSGSVTFTLTLNLTQGNEIIVGEYSGVITSSPFDGSTGGQSAGTVTTSPYVDGSITTTVTNDLLIVMPDCNNCGAFTASTNTPAGYAVDVRSVAGDPSITHVTAAAAGAISCQAGPANPGAGSTWTMNCAAFKTH